MTGIVRSARPVATGAGHEFRPDIEGMRALAVVAVLGYHFFPSFLPGGYFGVDAFFVISGYLITGVIARSSAIGTFCLRDFYARRIRRLFPAMLVVLAACWVAATVLLFSFELARFARHVTAALLYVENFMLSSELGYFDHDARGKPLLHLWSLAVEEQFYIVWPLLIALFARGRTKAIALLAGTVTLASLAYTLGPASGKATAFFDPLARAWELGMGAVLATMRLPRMPQALASARHPFSLGALAVLGAAMAWPVPAGLHPGPGTAVPVLATAGLIACGPDAWANRRILSLSAATWTGRISYPLYLWHWPLLAFPFFVLGDKPGPAVRLALLATSFVLAAATWRLIERPIRSRSDVRRIAAILLALAAGLLAITWGTVAWRAATPDTLQARVERQLEGPTWAFVANTLCEERFKIPPDHPFCMLSQDEPPTMLLVGNSFANHLYYGLSTDDRTRSHAILSYGSCNHMNGSTTAACRMQSSVARHTDSARVVFVSELWPEFTANGTMVDPVSKRPTGPDTPNAKQFAATIADWLRKMAGPGRTIVLVGPKPELAYDAKLCFDRPFKKAPENCSLAMPQAVDDMAGIREALQSAVKATPGAHYVEIHDLFCNDEKCRYVDREGLPLLRDNGHLSRLGSELVVDRLLDRLAARGISFRRNGVR